MKRCCVIGGTGFIGCHLVPLLLETGREVTVVGRRPEPVRPLSGRAIYLHGDYGDEGFIGSVLRHSDEVVLLAYSSVPKTSFDHPIEDIQTNLPAGVTLFRVAAELGLEKCIFVSSGGTVYGRTPCTPIAEDHPANPISPYGITKLAMEKYAHLYFELGDLPVVCVRPGNGYGPGQKPFVGQGFVATAMASILAGSEITLFGNGETIRDYLHVTDLAAGIVAALDHGVGGEVYNLGSGTGTSNRQILEIIEPMAARAGLSIRTQDLPHRRFDVPCNILNAEKLTAVSGWRPRVDLRKGLGRTWEWYRSNGFGASP